MRIKITPYRIQALSILSYLPLAAAVVAAALVAAAVDALVAVFGTIEIGTNTVYSNLAIQENEDVIRFRFQPQTKKLLIDLVGANIFSTPYLEIKNGHYEVDLQDDVYYFPVVQCVYNRGAEVHLCG